MSPASNRGKRRQQVWRFDLPSPDCVVMAPEGAEPVMVGIQNRAPYGPCVWMLVDLDVREIGHPFITTATGEDIPQDAAHVGSMQTPEGLVWHVWRPRGL